MSFYLISQQTYEKDNVPILPGKKTGGIFTFVLPSLNMLYSTGMCSVSVSEPNWAEGEVQSTVRPIAIWAEWQNRAVTPVCWTSQSLLPYHTRPHDFQDQPDRGCTLPVNWCPCFSSYILWSPVWHVMFRPDALAVCLFCVTQTSQESLISILILPVWASCLFRLYVALSAASAVLLGNAVMIIFLSRPLPPLPGTPVFAICSRRSPSLLQHLDPALPGCSAAFWAVGLRAGMSLTQELSVR